MNPLHPAPARLWFVRRNDLVTGPYPLGALAQEQALGRLGGATSISADGSRWLGVDRLRGMAGAQAHAETADDWSRQRAMARTRWADQRTGVDRRNQGSSALGDRRLGKERRTLPLTARASAPRRGEAAHASAERGVMRIVLLLIAAVTIGAALYGTSNPVAVTIDVRPLSR